MPGSDTSSGDPPTDPQAARSDEHLVRDANAGDVAAFEAIYERYQPWVLSLATRFTHDRELALDVMQETFFYLMRKFPGFGTDRETRPFHLTAKMTTFLYPVVKHLAIAARQKRRRLLLEGDMRSADAQPPTPPTPAAPAADDPATGASEDRQRAELSQVLANLSADHREVVLLRFVDGLSLQEIAAAVDAPLGTVKSRLHHALASLRNDPRTRDYFEG